jgi:hypothetical protein
VPMKAELHCSARTAANLGDGGEVSYQILTGYHPVGLPSSKFSFLRILLIKTFNQISRL